jgi:hypothetical protein
MAATSTVRLIEAMKPPEPDQPPTVMLKPKEKKKRLPGARLLIKLAKEREKEKAKRAAAREEAKRERPEVDEEEAEAAIEDVVARLEM